MCERATLLTDELMPICSQNLLLPFILLISVIVVNYITSNLYIMQHACLSVKDQINAFQLIFCSK